MITLVIGGARSGKSTWAEQQAVLAERERAASVTYLATAPEYAGDADWAVRIAAHQQRRPASWTTLATSDVAGALTAAAPGSVVIVDCLTMWLTAQLDEAEAWSADDEPADAVMRVASERIDALVDALRGTAADVICVTNEVGMGVVPMTASGRAFRDALGIVNARVGNVADTVVLVVAGQPLTIKPSPTSNDRPATH